MALPALRAPTFNHYGKYVVDQCVQCEEKPRGKLLHHQAEALRSLQDWFTNDRDATALVSMPTGSGKTGVICCLPYFLGSLGQSDFLFDKPVLIIAPNLEIASQLQGQILIARENPDANVNFILRRGILPPDDERVIRDALPVGLKIEETKDLRNARYLEKNDVIIANAQKFLRGEWENALPDDIFRLVIVDEAHHFPAPTWRKIIDKFKRHALVAFFTATPFRTDRQSVVEGQLAYHLPLADARDRRIIRRTNFIEVANDPGEEIVMAILKRVRAIQEQKDRDTPLPGDVPHMAMAIAKNQIEADQAAELWNEHWGDAIAYHSDVRPKQLLLQMMERIKNNEVKLVVVVDMLKEGFDHPPISIAVILTKIISAVKFVQFVGRSQRIVRNPDQENPNILADIVTHRYYEQRRNSDLFENEEFIE